MNSCSDIAKMEEEEDASVMAEKRWGTTDKYVPEVLIAQILSDLPVKSLLRLCTVSRSWNSTILRREFAERYRGREMAVLRSYPNDDKPLVCPLSSISSDKPMEKATPFVRPFKEDSYFDASCGELWCVEFEDSVVLYNPSTQKYRKLPTPSARVPIGSTVLGCSNSVFVYGLGYDSVADDYKILKIHRSFYVETELYSLKRDRWRKVKSTGKLPFALIFLSSKGVFASGALHWVISYLRPNQAARVLCRAILSFDLNAQRYKVLKLPKQPSPIFSNEGPSRSLGMTVFGGKLRVWENYGCYTRFAVWVMDDYESKLWTKELEVDYANCYPMCYSCLKPFYFYDSVGNPVKAVVSSTDMQRIFLCKEGEDGNSTLVGKDFGGDGCGMFDTYVESFASPFPGGS